LDIRDSISEMQYQKYFLEKIKKLCVNRESNPDLALGKRQC
jgi:hypothetical protein